MNPARIGELLAPFVNASTTMRKKYEPPDLCHSEEHSDEEPAVLSPAQLQSISTYIDILLRWNTRINLTSIRDPEQVVTRHFGESLFLARLLFPTRRTSGSANLQGHVADAQGAMAQASENIIPGDTAPRDIAKDKQAASSDRLSIADLGSGAGFPGLPIKLWQPEIVLTLIESNHRKAAFLREATRTLTLTDVNIQNTRAEAVQETFDTVTLRAVERFESTLPVAAALVAPKGRLALLIGSAQSDQARQTLRDFLWSQPAQVPLSRSRIVLIGTRPDHG